MRSIPTKVSPSTGVVIVAVIAACMTACNETSLPTPGPLVCEVAKSPDPCFRCQAERCGSQVDQCHGAGFHEGRKVGGVPRAKQSCQWNADTQQFDRNCGYHDGRPPDASPSSAPYGPCADFATCFQACGCGSECATSCKQAADGGATTTYFANDPRYEGGCSDCLQRVLAPCVQQHCAAECHTDVDGGW
jgi:hypothetical protein